MSIEPIFYIAFWLIFGGMIALQAYFPAWLRLTGKRLTIDRQAIEREGRWTVVVLAIRAIVIGIFLLLYAIQSPWLGALDVPIPDGLRWMGVVLGFASLALNAWSRATLGAVWSSCLQMRAEHSLVTTGPYACVRHPIYVAMIGFTIGIALVTANGLTIAFFVLSVLDLAFRIPKEEKMMIEAFGEEYRVYMRKTGGLFPRCGTR
jgi:protein-S-isoprenylcysteine O-methyltransferase Ste14